MSCFAWKHVMELTRLGFSSFPQNAYFRVRRRQVALQSPQNWEEKGNYVPIVGLLITIMQTENIFKMMLFFNAFAGRMLFYLFLFLSCFPRKSEPLMMVYENCSLSVTWSRVLTWMGLLVLFFFLYLKELFLIDWDLLFFIFTGLC